MLTGPKYRAHHLGGIGIQRRRGDRRAENAEPDRGYEHADIAVPEDGFRRHASRHEARIVGGPGHPGNAPADPDRGRQQRQHRQMCARSQRARQAPVDDTRARPCQDAHQHHNGDGRRHRVLLEGAYRVEAVDSDQHLHGHHQRDDDDLDRPCVGHAELPEDAHRDLDREVGVDPDPAQRHQEHQDARQVGAADPERGAAQHHLVDAGLVSHHREGREDRAADDIAEHDDCDRLHQA